MSRVIVLVLILALSVCAQRVDETISGTLQTDENAQVHKSFPFTKFYSMLTKNPKAQLIVLTYTTKDKSYPQTKVTLMYARNNQLLSYIATATTIYKVNETDLKAFLKANPKDVCFMYADWPSTVK